jgi:hypothetical protein
MNMIDEIRELNDAELDAVAGGIDIGAVGNTIAAVASSVPGGSSGSVMRKSAGGDPSGTMFLVYNF